MLSRANVILVLCGLGCMNCGGGDGALAEQPNQADDAADDDAPADDDTELPGFNDTDDDVPATDDDVGPTPTEPAADDDLASDDDNPTPAIDDDLPADDVPPADDDLPGDDDVATDDDAPVEEPMTPVMMGGLGSVGSACETDGDCLSGLECLDPTKTYFGGVYPNGVCTAACELDPFVCDSFGAACIGDESEAWCNPLCQIGGEGIKCRADQTCVPVDAEYLVGICDAMCRDDLDCPEGLECEATSGVCREMAHTGKALGESCSLDTPKDCEGMICLPATADATEGMCTQFCNLQADVALCGVARDAEGPAPGICDPITSLAVSGLPLAPGDMGLCTSGCEPDTGCLPGWTCAEVYPEVQDQIGHEGLCVFSDLLEPPEEPAPVGDAGAP